MNNPLSQFRADMHTHSTCSDGLLSPKELIKLAKEKGLDALSITDHDTIDAYDTSLFELAQELGIILCPGVEFSCQYKAVSIHVLGYGFDLSSEPLKNLCSRHQSRRAERNSRILRKLRTQGIVIEERELKEYHQEGVIGRPHIASVMIKKGYVSSIKEAFNKYIGDGKVCYDAGQCFTIDETIKIVHQAGGKVFIAHPHLIKKGKVLKEVLLKPFDGIECYYGAFLSKEHKKWLEMAKEKNWLISGGSDFHGESKPQNTLGSSWIDKEAFQKIFTSS